MSSITLTSPLDMHIHFREGDMMNLVAPLSAESFAGGVIMPNLVPPVDNLDQLLAYKTAVSQGEFKVVSWLTVVLLGLRKLDKLSR